MADDKYELINSIADKLNDKGWRDCITGQAFEYEKGLLMGFRFLLNENLKNILSQEITDNSADHWYNRLNSQGLFDIKPYGIAVNNRPVLVLRHNRLLSVSKDCFKIYEDADFNLVYMSGKYDMSFLIAKGTIKAVDKIRRYSKYTYMIWRAALVELGQHLKEFRTLYDSENTEDKTLIDIFLNDCIEFISGFRMNFTHKDIEKQLKISSGHIYADLKYVNQIIDKQDKIIGFLVCHEYGIKIETTGGQVVTFNIPTITTDTDLSYYSNKPSIQEAEQLYKKVHYNELLIILAMYYAGIIFTHNDFEYYNKNNKDTLKSLVHDIKKLSDLTDMNITF